MFVLSWRFSLELMFDEKLSLLGNEADFAADCRGSLSIKRASRPQTRVNAGEAAQQKIPALRACFSK
jgi:hypothetical protein